MIIVAEKTFEDPGYTTRVRRFTRTSLWRSTTLRLSVIVFVLILAINPPPAWISTPFSSSSTRLVYFQYLRPPHSSSLSSLLTTVQVHLPYFALSVPVSTVRTMAAREIVHQGLSPSSVVVVIKDDYALDSSILMVSSQTGLIEDRKSDGSRMWDRSLYSSKDDPVFLVSPGYPLLKYLNATLGCFSGDEVFDGREVVFRPHRGDYSLLGQALRLVSQRQGVSDRVKFYLLQGFKADAECNDG
ncbi:hypothetical protein BGX29_005490 [Mortierella sp. GBA35]|nr:hypothetical protein BGX29_005490 [Mortierella sp. GBA35]